MAQSVALSHRVERQLLRALEAPAVEEWRTDRRQSLVFRYCGQAVAPAHAPRTETPASGERQRALPCHSRLRQSFAREFPRNLFPAESRASGHSRFLNRLGRRGAARLLSEEGLGQPTASWRMRAITPTRSVTEMAPRASSR